MSMSISERRQIENEMIFRRKNEKVGKELAEHDKKHIEEDNPELVWDDDIELFFVCECSDENCKEKVELKLSEYQKIHKNRSAFVIKHDHQVAEIEKVTKTKEDFMVVEKDRTLASAGKTLNETSIDNS